MTRCCQFVAIIAVVIVSSARLVADDQPLDVSELLAPLLEKHKVPALAAAVIEGERVTKLGAAGIRARGDAAKVELDDVWHLGSCTKAITATLCARLVEQGKLKWDSKVGDVFADQAEQIHAEWRDVTLVQLLSHRASLPSIPPLPLWLKLVGHDGSRDAREMLLSGGWLKSAPTVAPGSKWEYSNAGFMLAGLMAARRFVGGATSSAMAELVAPPTNHSNTPRDLTRYKGGSSHRGPPKCLQFVVGLDDSTHPTFFATRQVGQPQ